AVPDSVVEAKLHFLFNIARKVVGRDPTGVNVERRLAAVVVLVDHPQLRRIPRRAIGRADQPALTRAGDALQSAAKGEIDQLDVVYGDIRARVAAGDPLGELPARD